MEINAYLNFNGQCEAAFKFYEQVLGGKILMMSRFENSPMAQQMPAEMRSKILHARIRIGDTLIMGSDPPPDRFSAQKGFALSLQVKTGVEAEKLSGHCRRVPKSECRWARHSLPSDLEC